MSIWRQLSRGLRRLTDRQSSDREISEEVDHYLQKTTEAFLQRGLSPEAARRAAILEMGGATAVREQVRSYGWENLADNLFADLRYGIRRLAGNPGFTAVSVLTLALGIGASTAIFSVVEAVLLRALPYAKPEQMVRIWEQAPDGHPMNLADPNFDDFRDQNDSFAHMAAYEELPSSISGGSEPVRVNIAEVSREFFPAFGVDPVRGRGFAPEEQRLHGSPAALVSYRYWQRYLGGNPDLSQFHLAMEGGVFPVVGVMPESFDFPAGVSAWIPRELYPELPDRTAHNWRCIGRLRDGATLARARSNLGAIAHRIQEQYGKRADLKDVSVVPLADALVGNVRTGLLTLMGAVGLLLLVACANVAGLLLARTSARRRELAVRAALGAGRGRLIQQFLVESFTLSAAGGGLGVMLAASAVRALPAILPADLPRQDGIAIDPPVLLFALASVVGVAMALGLFAAWRSAAADLQTALTSGARSSGAGAGNRFRGVLVTGEIAATLVILMGAGLLGRSFLRLISTDPGFRTENLISLAYSISNHEWEPEPDRSGILRQVRLTDEALSRLRAIPGVVSAGFAGAMPVAAGDDLADGDFLILNGRKAPTNFQEWRQIHADRALVGHALYALAGEAYFRTMGIPLVRGRMFDERDDWNAPHVAIISQTLARQRWPGQDPIGQSIEFGNMDGNLQPLTIVGIAADVRARGLDLPPGPIIYVSYRQRGLSANTSPTILLRSTGSAGQIASAARRVFHDLDPNMPVKISTFAQEMGGWLADRRFLLLLVALFALAALALAAIGIYGVVAFSAARRTQEIGVRMALGARRGDVLRLIVGEGARLAAGGVAIGLAASYAITRLLSSLLFGISSTDPLTFACVAALLTGVALLASYLPARRAMRLDPTVALRYE